VALVAGATGALLATAVLTAGGPWHSVRTIRTVEQFTPAPTQVIATSTTTVDETVETLADRLRPAIVRLTVTTAHGTVSGSGVLFRSDGQILTNTHVTAGATHVTVVLTDGRRYTGLIVGSDTDTDVSVVRIAAGGQWPVAQLGSASALRTGQSVLAIGSPLGMVGGPSLSRGVVSALGSQVVAHDGSSLLDMIQTDATIAEGSSGGALVDLSGMVVGITTVVTVTGTGTERLGFATPIDTARRIADELVATGHATHVWLGIGGGDLDPAAALVLGVNGGARVDTVDVSSPAAKAGLKDADVITTLDGHPVTSMAGLMVSLRARAPGETVELGLYRSGQAIEIGVTLGSRPGDA
jgi:S1-C subfamily serine protease